MSNSCIGEGKQLRKYQSSNQKSKMKRTKDKEHKDKQWTTRLGRILKIEPYNSIKTGVTHII